MYVPAFFGLLLAALVTGQHVDITPTKAVRRVGDNITVLCKVDYPIDSCRMLVGTTSYRLVPNQGGDIAYAGQGLNNGECGVHIKRISEDLNGKIECIVPPKSGSGIEVTGTMDLIVAKAPDAPILYTPEPLIFREGDQYQAMCVVANGRPAARISWFLGNEQLLMGIHQPIIEVAPNSDLATVRANVTRRLSADDGGLKLTCRAEHEAMNSPLEASTQLSVQYPPRRADSSEDQITIFGLKLGSEGRLNVTVRAHPPPSALWTVSGNEMQAPAHNEDGSINVLSPVPLGGGYYNLSLILRRVEKTDVERKYLLSVVNDVGEAKFTLHISTMDEPAGVELDTGAVVGIVIAALVLVAAISLLVFAKATDRWCFAGPRDPTKSSGESDTESAAGGRWEARAGRARAAARGAWGRVRAALPAGRDKVQASEQAHDGDEDKPVEKKEGVVYAELALGDTGAPREGERPPPASTEYAEIVYTDQGQKEAKE